MPVTPTYPGVYVQEVPSGVRTIVGVSTSIALFIGRTKKGTLKKTKLCLSYSDFVRAFSADAAQGDLPRQVKMFFLNGGTRCCVMRIANGATTATVTLKSETLTDALTLTAKDAGLVGEDVRAAVTYSGTQPEGTFHLELFRWETDAKGQKQKAGRELWTNLSMDPQSARYAPTFITQNSLLVDASVSATPVAASSFSQAGRPVAHNSGGAPAFDTAWAAVLGAAATANRFQISVGGSSYVEVNLKKIKVTGKSKAALEAAVQAAINAQLPAGTTVTATFEAGPTPQTGGAPDTTTLLTITSTSGDVLLQPSTNRTEDLAVPLMLGAAQGGLEVSGYVAFRPAPTGMVFESLTELIAFAGKHQDAFDTIIIDGTEISLGADLQTVAANAPMYVDAIASSQTGNCDGIREKWGIIADAINEERASNPSFKWSAAVWGTRLALIPGDGGDNSEGTIASKKGAVAATFGSEFSVNVRYYSVGSGGTGSYQTPGAAASDGTAPKLSDYADAYEIVDKEVDLFNLLILPKDTKHSASTTQSLWGPASTFCEERRAFLLMDPPDWADVQAAIHPQTGVYGLRVGLSKDHSAIFYPNIKITEDDLELTLGPSGTIAGLMARIDGTRGVWKAPAGTEADLRGVAGLQYQVSDRENGVLNPCAINTLRSFPDGIVNWGARTMDGDDNLSSEYKYIPIRRLALFLEESLYRGLKWVVFEPNDEPLWAQIRLNVGAFMHDLFRKGAFQGATPKDAYFVKCDAETTTQTDQNLGIVNIWVGFAPLKPAEFVIIYLQQMAGQIQV